MIKGSVTYRSPEEVFNYDLMCVQVKEFRFTATLINVLWHPVDGPSVAVLTDCDEIEIYPLDKFEVQP